MSSDIAIRLKGLSKCYQIYDQPRNRLLQMLFRGTRKYYREFWAVRDISFDIKKGETVGIIGRNGSGKSTLLQLICGTLNPTTGTIEINGRIAALLELGAGFNPEFSGRENVYLSATLYGLSRNEIDSRFDDIASFADIGNFIDQPVKTYSSGMFVRLAFAVIAHVDADILVIDEALSVGDAYFVQRCMRFLRSFMERGTLLFCSHDTSAVVNLCSSAILLNRGTLEVAGKPKSVVEQYLAAICESQIAESTKEATHDVSFARDTHQEYQYRDMREALINGSSLRNDIEVFRFNSEGPAFGAGAARVVSVRLLDIDGMPLSWVVGGQDVTLEVLCQADETLSRPIVGFEFKDRLGQTIFGDNTFIACQFDTPQVIAGGELVARFDFRLPVLPSGDYSIAVAIADGTQEIHVHHHWVFDALMLRVHASSVCLGLVGIPMRRISLVAEGPNR